MENIKFAPFYNDGEADKFRYYSVPQILFTDDVFQPLNALSKLLYSFLLDRTGLSRKQKWHDADGRLYLYFQTEEAMEKLNVSKPTAVKLFKELEDIGLIQRKRQGQGMPTKIYVNDFSRYQTTKTVVENSVENMLKPVENCHEEAVRSQIFLPLEVNEIDHKKSKIFTSRSKESLPPEVKNFYLSPITNLIDQPDDPSFLSTSEETKKRWEKMENGEASEIVENADMAKNTDYAKCLSQAMAQIQADKLDSDGAIGELVQLMAWVAATDQPQILIHGIQCNTEAVRARFRLLTRAHLQYVVNCVHDSKTTIRNRRHYLLSCLYDAPDAYAASRPVHNRSRPQQQYVSEHAEDYRSFIYNIDE